LHLNQGRREQDLSIKMLEKNKLDGMLDLVTARATGLSKSKPMKLPILTRIIEGILSRHSIKNL
jgi:hypothetical protein